jgi:hypothetical protein
LAAVSLYRLSICVDTDEDARGNRVIIFNARDAEGCKLRINVGIVSYNAVSLSYERFDI